MGGKDHYFARFGRRLALLARNPAEYLFRYPPGPAYTSILYLKKYENFQIILRGKPVEHISVANDLKFKKVVTYKPQVTHDSQVPYWNVLEEGSSTGRSVVGVLEANFIEPAHDKQDFERTPLFIRLETKLRQIIIDYWKERCHLIDYRPMDAQVRSQYKDGRKDSGGPGPNDKQKSPTGQRIGRRPSNLLPEIYEDATANCAEKVNFYVLAPFGAKETRPYKVPLCIYEMLKPHQKDGLDWLWSLHCNEKSGGIVADDMGLGKTQQMTTFLAGLFHSDIISRALIITPVSIIGSWTKELEKVGLDRRVHIYETSGALDTIAKEKAVILISYEMYCKEHEILASHSQNWDYVVLDEGHRIKNLKAHVTIAMNKIQCVKKVLMTGTPLCRDLEDIYALLNFIELDIFGSEAFFRNKYILPISKGQYINSSEDNKQKYFEALARCRKVICPFLLRRNKSVLIESGELPCKKHDIIVWLKLTDLQVILYKNLYNLYGPGKSLAKDDNISFTLSKH
ncbi:hypothetical protein ACQ4PT_065983 [Festuca glaucescens]